MKPTCWYVQIAHDLSRVQVSVAAYTVKPSPIDRCVVMGSALGLRYRAGKALGIASKCAKGTLIRDRDAYARHRSGCRPH